MSVPLRSLFLYYVTSAFCLLSQRVVPICSIIGCNLLCRRVYCVHKIYYCNILYRCATQMTVQRNCQTQQYYIIIIIRAHCAGSVMQ